MNREELRGVKGVRIFDKCQKWVRITVRGVQCRLT